MSFKKRLKLAHTSNATFSSKNTLPNRIHSTNKESLHAYITKIIQSENQKSSKENELLEFRSNFTVNAFPKGNRTSMNPKPKIENEALQQNTSKEELLKLKMEYNALEKRVKKTEESLTDKASLDPKYLPPFSCKHDEFEHAKRYYSSHDTFWKNRIENLSSYIKKVFKKLYIIVIIFNT